MEVTGWNVPSPLPWSMPERRGRATALRTARSCFPSALKSAAREPGRARPRTCGRSGRRRCGCPGRASRRTCPAGYLFHTRSGLPSPLRSAVNSDVAGTGGAQIDSRVPVLVDAPVRPAPEDDHAAVPRRARSPPDRPTARKIAPSVAVEVADRGNGLVGQSPRPPGTAANVPLPLPKMTPTGGRSEVRSLHEREVRRAVPVEVAEPGRRRLTADHRRS